MRNVVELISAFAVVGVIVGIIITIIAENGSVLADVGMGTVVFAGIVAVIFQIVIWFMKKRDSEDQ